MAFSLKAILGLETSKFERGLAKARAWLSSSVGAMMKSLAPLAGFVGFSTLASSAVNMAKEITNLSKVANTNAEEFQRLAYGAKLFSVEQDKLADILKDTQDKIGDFLTTGAGPMADFFEKIAPKVGVTAEEFRNLSGPDALQLYYNSLQKANLSQAEMTFFMEAIASDATMLEPLLRDNGKRWKELSEEAENAGLVLSDLDRKQLRATSQQLDIMKKRATILTAQFLNKLIPAFSLVGQGLGFIADLFGAGAAVVVSYGKALAFVVSAIIKPAITAFDALALGVEGTMQAMAGNFEAAKKAFEESKRKAFQIASDFNSIPQKLLAINKDVTVDILSAWEVMGKSVERRNESIQASIDKIKGTTEDTIDTLNQLDTLNNPPEPGSTTVSKGGEDMTPLEMQNKIKELKLEALKAEVRGEEALAKSLNNRIKLAERIVQIMSETGASFRDAMIIANKQVRKEIGAIPIGVSVSNNQKVDELEQRSQMLRTPTIEERERAAGLTDTMSGRGPARIEDATTMQQKETLGSALKQTEKSLQGMSNSLTRIEQVMTKE